MNPYKWLWLASISLLPFLFIRNTQVGQLDPVLFRTVVWSIFNFLIVALGWKEISVSVFKKIGVLSFLGYLALAILSYLVVHFLYSPFQLEGVSEIIRLINCFFSIIFSVHFIQQEKKNIHLLTKIVALQTVVLAGVGVLQSMEILENCAEGASPCGFLMNRNLFGSALVLGLPFMLFVLKNTIENEEQQENNFINIIFNLVGLSSILLGIYLSQTRSAYAATAFIGLFYVLYFLLHLRFLYVAVVIIVLGSIGSITYYKYSILNPDNFGSNPKEQSWRDLTKTDSQAERLLMWEKTLSMIKENPILGVGFQNWKYQIPKYSLEGLRSEKNELNVQRPHNDFLWIAAESGIITLFIYLLMMGYMVYVGIKNKNILVLVVFAFLIDSMFSFPKERIAHSLILTVSMGVILVNDKKLLTKNSNFEKIVNDKENIKVEEKVITKQPNQKKKNKIKHKTATQQAIQKDDETPKIVKSTADIIPNYVAYLSLFVLGICVYISFVQSNDKEKTIQLLSYNQSQNFNAVLPVADQINKYFVPSDYFINSVYMHKGYASLNLKKQKVAKEDYLKGLKQMPYSIALLKQVAMLYQNEKKYDSAIFYYQKMQNVIPHLPETYQQMYNNYLLKGDTASAREIIKKCPAPCK
ncbi:O-antigen ligase family protein [Bernardetia sp.]|uniref:O-antigen ligase family protein n=1 Tax=Bernardetia sp. TaxID=1937974 RepID=UPI0025BC36AC|nr:O-antigen ligase family protein [Bernardetia sp.]